MTMKNEKKKKIQYVPHYLDSQATNTNKLLANYNITKALSNPFLKIC